MATREIQVSCRVRHDPCPERWSPCVNVDVSARRVVVVHPSTPTVDNNVSINDSGTAYTCFDGVYSSQSTQEEIFESVGRPFVADLLAGYNCTIIAYGQTGSGKTYTVVGEPTVETQGLIPRAMEAIFEEIARFDPEEYDASLTASFVEIYQEKLRDLLLPSNSRILRLREDKEHNVRVEGASEITVSSVATGMAILSRGNGHRSTGSTLMNADSSRSHSVFILTLTKKHITSGMITRGKMFIVDLAGSEKVQKTAAAGVRMEEAKHINRSLSALGNVINALTDEKTKHVPYRDSKLTRLLQTSLGGNAKTHLLLTCSSSISHLEETVSTLRFGSRAKNIQNKPHVNSKKASAGAEYGELLTSLQNKIENLHGYIRQLEMSPCKFCGSDLDIDSRNCPAALNPVEKDTTTETNDVIVDDMMRAEMQSLRKALTNLMHDHETQEHAHNVARTMMEVTEQQLDSRHRSQEQTIQQQELALQDASTTIARLEKKLEAVEETAQVLSGELHRLQRLQQQQLAGENAEAEILRRQLDASTKLAKQLQAKLTASRQGQEGMVDLRERLINKEHELSSLRSEVEMMRLKKVPVTLQTAVAPGLSSPPRIPQTHPVTAADFKALGNASPASRGDSKYGNMSMSNIQNWWAGSIDEPERNQDEAAESHVQSSPMASKTLKREYVLPPAENTNRVCLSAGSAIRPFRARLVGLLNSLEEETTAYRELVVETKERTASRSGGRPRLPGLDTNLLSPKTS